MHMVFWGSIRVKIPELVSSPQRQQLVFFASARRVGSYPGERIL